MSAKKILILANSSSGLYDFRNELVKELLTEYEVVASLPDEVKTKELHDEGVRIVKTAINRHGVNPREDLKLYRAYRRLLKEEKPDLVLTYTIKPNIYGGYACQRAGIPYIETITGLGTTFQKEGVLKKLIVIMYRVAVKRAKCIFFQNSVNMEIFEAHGIAGQTKRLVNGSGVDLDIHKVLEFPPDNDRLQLLYIGRNMKDKGTEELLEAAQYFKDDSNIEFKLLGYSDGDYEEQIRKLSDEGVIVTHDYDTDVEKHMLMCQAVILPTYHEGMSNVLQEAGTCGRAVIASDIPGCREIFEDGITGMGCEPRNSKSLIDAIERFISLSYEERKNMGLKARAKMEREFDRRRVTEAYLEEIKR